MASKINLDYRLDEICKALFILDARISNIENFLSSMNFSNSGNYDDTELKKLINKNAEDIDNIEEDIGTIKEVDKENTKLTTIGEQLTDLYDTIENIQDGAGQITLDEITLVTGYNDAGEETTDTPEKNINSYFEALTNQLNNDTRLIGNVKPVEITNTNNIETNNETTKDNETTVANELTKIVNQTNSNTTNITDIKENIIGNITEKTFKNINVSVTNGSVNYDSNGNVQYTSYNTSSNVVEDQLSSIVNRINDISLYNQLNNSINIKYNILTPDDRTYNYITMDLNYINRYFVIDSAKLLDKSYTTEGLMASSDFASLKKQEPIGIKIFNGNGKTTPYFTNLIITIQDLSPRKNLHNKSGSKFYNYYLGESYYLTLINLGRLSYLKTNDTLGDPGASPYPRQSTGITTNSYHTSNNIYYSDDGSGDNDASSNVFCYSCLIRKNKTSDIYLYYCGNFERAFGGYGENDYLPYVGARYGIQITGWTNIPEANIETAINNLNNNGEIDGNILQYCHNLGSEAENIYGVYISKSVGKAPPKTVTNSKYPNLSDSME